MIRSLGVPHEVSRIVSVSVSADGAPSGAVPEAVSGSHAEGHPPGAAVAPAQRRSGLAAHGGRVQLRCGALAAAEAIATTSVNRRDLRVFDWWKRMGKEDRKENESSSCSSERGEALKWSRKVSLEKKGIGINKS